MQYKLLPSISWLVVVTWLLCGGASAAPFLDAEEAERIVRAQWFEGVPEDRIGPLTLDAVRRLAALLDDPAEADAHAPALELLGRAGGPGAYESITAYASRPLTGAVNGADYRAQLAIPLALGYLARRDERALAALIEAAGPGAAASAWTHRHLDAARTGVLRQKMAITGLALSGRPEAHVALMSLATTVAPSQAARGSAGRFSDLRAHVDEALRTHARSAAALEEAR